MRVCVAQLTKTSNGVTRRFISTAAGTVRLFFFLYFFTFSLFCSYFLQYADGSRQIIIAKTRQQLGCIDKLRKGIDGIDRARYVEKCFISKKKKKKKKKAEGNRSIHLIDQGRDEPRRAEPIGSLNV